MIKTTLRPHQREAVAKAIPFNGFALFPEPRVGKTLVGLAITDHHKPDRILILCPDIAIGEWQKQIEEHTVFEWEPEIRIMTYQAAIQKRTRSALNRWLKGHRSMTILDEGHVTKKYARRYSRTCFGFGKRSMFRLLLTGTPISQGLQDGFALMRFVDPEVFPPTFAEFRERYLKMGGYFNRKVIGFRNEEEFKEKFHSRAFRITFKESLGGSKKLLVRRQKLYAPMTEATRVHYDELSEELQTYVKKTKKVKVQMVAQLAMKLQQLTGGHLIDEHHEAHRVAFTKENLLTKWMTHHWDRKSPFIVVCRFLHEIDALEPLLKAQGLNVQVIRGGRKLEDQDFDCVILQIQSGLAIDLSRANTVIFYSWDYSYINFEQTRFRILSYNQTRVTYVFLMLKGSIDDLLYEVVTKKKKLSDTVCDHFRRG